MTIEYEQVCYSWLHGGNYNGIASDGWGIAGTSNTEPAFLKGAVDLMTNRSAASEETVTEYYEYSPLFHRFIYLGVRKLPSISQMGGGDNNRLMHLYIPVQVLFANSSEKQAAVSLEEAAAEVKLGGFPEIGELDYRKYVPDPQQRGIWPRAVFPCKTYEYQEILKKYGFQDTQENRGEHRLAVLLSLLYLSFYSDEWKRLIFPVGEQDPYEIAREITWLSHQLVPEQIFGKKRMELIQNLGYTAGEQTKGNGLIFYKGSLSNLSLKEHVYNLNGTYDAAVDISKEQLDRKAADTAGFFLELARKAQKSPEVARAWIQKILKETTESVDTLQELGQAYQKVRVQEESQARFQENLKAESQADSQENLKEESKVKPQENLKEESKVKSQENLKEESKVKPQENLKEESKVEPQENLKEESQADSSLNEMLDASVRAASEASLKAIWGEDVFGCRGLDSKGSADESSGTTQDISSLETMADANSSQNHQDTADRIDALVRKKKKGGFFSNLLRKKRS